MSAIHFRDLSFHYSKAVPILESASFSLGRGWTGVVGSNGSGKTTILGLIEGSLSATGGSLRLDPPDAIVTLCPQTADTIDPNTETLRAAFDRDAQTLVGRLGLDRNDLDRWPTLSPGERKRWQVGGALYRRPDVLLLDEPTNHLDSDARALLMDELHRFGGIGLVVSHDRTVLNRLCRRIVRIEHGTAELWQGSYDIAHRAWTAAEQAEYESYRALRAQQKKVKRRLADKRRTTEAKTARHKRDLRQAGTKDKDARSMAKKGRFEGGLRQASREMSLLRAETERLEEAATRFDLERRLGGDLFFDYEPARRRLLLRYEGPLAIGPNSLLGDVDVTVDRDDRILLAGPNGSGKSTLLRVLMAESTLPAERLLHLPQELTEGETAALVESVRSLGDERMGRVLGIVGVLGSDPKRVLATDAPSPGEARKLLIAYGLGRGAWVLLLDEPTNHLDLPSIERLEAALEAFPGALVVATHDDEFAGHTTRTRWDIGGGQLTLS